MRFPDRPGLALVSSLHGVGRARTNVATWEGRRGRRAVFLVDLRTGKGPEIDAEAVSRAAPGQPAVQERWGRVRWRRARPAAFFVDLRTGRVQKSTRKPRAGLGSAGLLAGNVLDARSYTGRFVLTHA